MWKALSLVALLVSCSQAPVSSSKRSGPRRAKISRTKPEVETPAPRTDLKLVQKINDRNAVVLDLREVNDFVNGHVKGAVHMDFLRDDFEGRVAQLDKRKKYLLYCSTGGLSGKAIHYFIAKKLRVENIGTFDDLKSRGAPMEGVEE